MKTKGQIQASGAVVSCRQQFGARFQALASSRALHPTGNLLYIVFFSVTCLPPFPSLRKTGVLPGLDDAKISTLSLVMLF